MYKYIGLLLFFWEIMDEILRNYLETGTDFFQIAYVIEISIVNYTAIQL